MYIHDAFQKAHIDHEGENKYYMDLVDRKSGWMSTQLFVRKVYFLNVHNQFHLID